MRTHVRRGAAALILALASALTLAHETVRVGTGDEQYDVVVGFVREPAFTDERTGLDLIIRRAADREGVEGLVGSLEASITSPDGQHTHVFTLRAQWGRPGAYTDDIILTATGVYTIRVWGFIGGVEVDETYQSHEVRDLASLRFP
jgi:hypothetical protein